MERRRVLFKLALTYDTTADQLRQLPGVIERIIKGYDGVEFDRSHFSEYGNFSLNIESVYFVLSRDYRAYMDIQEKINLAIMEEFKRSGRDLPSRRKRCTWRGRTRIANPRRRQGRRLP